MQMLSSLPILSMLAVNALLSAEDDEDSLEHGLLLVVGSAWLGKYCWNVCFWMPSSREFNRVDSIALAFSLSFNLVSSSTIFV